MLNIYLVRHGQDRDNEAGILNGHRNEPLTDLGLRQAQELAIFIKGHGLNFDAVYSSPLKRAYTTACKITEVLGLPNPEILDELIERDFGVMTGEKISDIERLCAPDIIKTDTICYFLDPEGAETFPQLIERAKDILKRIETKHAEGNVLLVGHGDFGKMIYAAYYGLNWEEVLKSFHFGNAELLLLAKDEEDVKTEIFKTKQYNN